ncbi:MAG: SHD1 domain-containing protein [Kiritimatiellae bacterium]|nr:SHD1 domain-containing protein [Kiritimatiellia bacterium]MDD3545258.1 SHD1 domain-containing protein [Kiritimatiellia bacterium]MDD4025847.1 SHD1 domain-containing protein [Kiritimatiellia bacterium]MDD4623196.1 SHD1 domain-containing protein [Kiritimatiellia bacterium]
MTYQRTPLMTGVFCIFLNACALRAGAQAQPQPTAPRPQRVWTSVNGNTVQAAFEREEDGKIFLKRPDGSTVATTRAKLSPNDLAWIDAARNPAQADKTLSFTKATMPETNRMEHYRKVRRLIIRTYANLTDNDRDDKMLGFLERDALSIHGWGYIGSDCYLTPAGKKGKIKELYFRPQEPVPLREAVEMARDKFTIVMPDPVLVKQVSYQGGQAWELQNPPDYLARVLLLADEETGNIKRFDIHFPRPK